MCILKAIHTLHIPLFLTDITCSFNLNIKKNSITERVHKYKIISQK